ncbi:hypothetical protein CcaCcLH18_07479 [Colletotrichum camelliae]|nr:hypothetical protein CcaCcLH18_07479 [Colletotrichum camelliae]
MRCINASSASSMTQFRLYDADEMKRSGVYPHSKLGACTNSETAFEQIRKWLDACFEKHSYCRGFLSSSQTPTRLVHINWAKQKIQVLESMDANTQYVALSYRWGDSQSAYKLTAKTKLELTSESGVSMDRLPKTIYDACSALQDCTDDWAREASKMSQPGIEDRSHRNFQPLHLRIRPSEMEAHKTMIIEPGNRDEDDPKAMLGHLVNRGWVFQERILSRRTVYYTKEQIFWECSTLKASELWPEGKFHDWSLAIPYHRDYYPGSKPSRRACEGDCRCGVQMLPRDRDKWQQIVMDYTKRVFTFEEDRLPGLSGLATDFKKNHRDDEDEYYAGLWKSNIIEDLCWSAGTPPPAIPTKYRAPSWSWASLESKITYHRSVMGGFISLVI